MSRGVVPSQTDMVWDLVEQAARLGTWTWDAKTHLLHWSGGMFELLGLATSTASPSFELYRSLIIPADRSRFKDPFQLLADGATNEQVFRLETLDGELRHVRTCSRIEYSAEGDIERIVGVDLDVTELHGSGPKQSQCFRMMKTAGQLLDAVIWQADADGSNTTILSHGQSEGDWAHAGWDKLALIHPEDRPRVVAAWNHATRVGEEFLVEFRVWCNNACTPVIARAAPVHGNAGEITGWIGLTQRKGESSISPGQLVERSSQYLSASEIRAARGLLGWSAQQLADVAGVSFSTVRRIEAGHGINVRAQSLSAIRAAFENANVDFIQIADGTAGIIYKETNWL